MFIRQTKTRSKRSNEGYIKHVLVESTRADGQPRQRVIMGLGRLDLPRREWKKLAHALECHLSGQASLLEDNDKHIDALAQSLVCRNKLSQKLRIPDAASTEATPPETAKAMPRICPQSVTTEKTRTIGAELLCQNAWDLLCFDTVLKDCGFSLRHRAVVKALIFGRMISPGSERHCIEWYRKRSALSEFPDADVSDREKDVFYEQGDRLYAHKDTLEAFLFKKQQTLFPLEGYQVYLYDLTNTYLEGSALANQLAARGHCKSKRSDCPLIALSLVVRSDGVPVASHIYRGNQGEPETLKDALTRLSVLFGYDDAQMVLEKPTLIMDRGIATHDNLMLLREKEYPYVVVAREDQTGAYRSEFETARETFTLIDDLSHKRTPYGDENRVYVKKVKGDDEKSCKVLCLSDGKAHKENAILRRNDTYFLADMEKLNNSIQKGSIKNKEKIEARHMKIRQRHKSAAARYVTSLATDSAGKVKGIEIVSSSDQDEPLSGCYVIESTHTHLDAVSTWQLYMSQVRVESAFRSLKSQLGVRPVYHQRDDRSSAHLFISVLAYHLLCAIELRLEKHGDTRQWKTLRSVLSTHTRTTVVMKDDTGRIYHQRVSGKPEAVHADIYKKLKVLDPTTPITISFR